jgi:hypothetical protein
MPVHINVSRHAVEARVTEAWNKGLAALSEEVLNDCNLYCKHDTGMLIQSSYVHSVPREGKLIWQTPYARRQYWEIKTAVPDMNPQASWKWCEVAKRKHSEQWERQAQRLMDMNL